MVPWLRLVQAAMDAEEQNTEAYLKSGQLYFRTIRGINQGEELLVWYDEELSHLLGFSDIKTRALTDGEDRSHCYRSRMSFLFQRAPIHKHLFLAITIVASCACIGMLMGIILLMQTIFIQVTRVGSADRCSSTKTLSLLTVAFCALK